MKILFGALHFGYFRNYEQAILRLVARGHQLHLTADIHDVTGGQALVERLAAEHLAISWSVAPQFPDWSWFRTTRQVRHGLEAARFAAPAYDALPKYRRRSIVKAPKALVSLLRWGGGSAMISALAAIERGIPPPPSLMSWMRDEQPDVVLLASVTNDGAPQMDHLKAALSLGLRTSLPVFSWDHLSGKALLHVAPAQVLVWNEAQRREAIELHGLPADRIEVTGAYGYEQWFASTPSRDRGAFLRECGLDPARPVLAYVCSVLSRPAPPEAPFVLEWIRALRGSSDPDIRAAGIIVRPHPERLAEWAHIDLSGLGPVAIRGSNPIDAASRAEYFDTLHHAAAVVGIITSAFIEAAVVGRVAMTIEDPRFAEHQSGAPHYHYLRDDTDGLLLVAPDLPGHVQQMSRLVSGDDTAARARTARFVDRFVRPPGGHASASDVFAAAVEALMAQPAPAPVVFGRGVERVGAALVRGCDRMPLVRRLLWNDQDAASSARLVEQRKEKLAVTGARRERQAREDRERAVRERARAERMRDKDRRVTARARAKDANRVARQRARRLAEVKGRIKSCLSAAWPVHGGRD